MLCRIFIFLLISGCSVRPLYDYDASINNKNNIYVEVIPNRDGQKLRSFLKNNFRDLGFTNEEYRLSISLKTIEQPFAIAIDDDAQRLMITYIADFNLMDANKKIILSNQISVSSSANISTPQADVMFSLYGTNSDALLKELAYRIIENIKIYLLKIEKSKN